VELTLIAAALAETIWGHRSVVAFLVIASFALALHLAIRGKRSVIRSRASLRNSDLSLEMLLAVWTFATILYLIPAHAGLGAGVAGTLLAGAVPLTLRPLRRFLVMQKWITEGVLIAGNGDMAKTLYRALDNDSGPREELPKGVLAFSSEREERGTQVNFLHLDDIVRRDGIGRIVVAEEDPQARASLSSALVDLRLRGLQVEDAVDFYEEIFGKTWVEALSSEWFLHTKGFHHSSASVALKRLVDFVCALVLLLLTAPVMAAVAIAIKLDSPGPILFRQFRIGLFGKPFVIYKFRSMRQNAESLSGPRWAAENDNRLTRIGGFLRKYRFDELPQLFNVLRGEMSVVGPRPERPCFLDRLTESVPFYDLRHYVKPGITGWAQVKYRYGASVHDAAQKLEYDIFYAKHRSFLRDLNIMFQTVAVVALGKGQ
jgi:sugar transferase (PEP-CTERM system associated)